MRIHHYIALGFLVLALARFGFKLYESHEHDRSGRAHAQHAAGMYWKCPPDATSWQDCDKRGEPVQ